MVAKMLERPALVLNRNWQPVNVASPTGPVVATIWIGYSPLNLCAEAVAAAWSLASCDGEGLEQPMAPVKRTSV